MKYYTSKLKESVSLQPLFLRFTYKKMILAISHLNYSYMLGLDDDKIIAISRIKTDNPIYGLSVVINKDLPTVADFCLNMEDMLNDLMDSMRLKEQLKNNLYLSFISDLLAEVSDDFIKEIADGYADTLLPQFYFLRNKINYELCCLGFIMQYAINTGNKPLAKKVNKHRKKNAKL